MELLEIDLSGEAPLRFEVLRALSEGEAKTPGQSVQKSQGMKLRERHHGLARLLAAGVPAGQCASITGYCPSRVSVLQADPSFQELLEFYRGNLNVAALDMQAKLGTLAADTISEIQDRLEEDPQGFKNSELTELLKASCDRIGLGPSSTVKNLNLNATATLAELKAQVLAEQRGQVISIEGAS